ncbi:hypothetical protein BDV93DRAFT_509488 [Ceratobasidium sp. AG-I]|nr:hypothetical protein BDV93DRAFT_509488 [Ceratobasidium sp. AG-I]
MSGQAKRWGVSYRTWAIGHSLLTLFGASTYTYLIWYSYNILSSSPFPLNSDAVEHPQLSISSSEKLAMVATGLVYTAVALFASVGLVGCLKKSPSWLWAYEKFTWALFLAQIGVTGWFLYAVFVDREGLLWKCKTVLILTQFGTLADTTAATDPVYESLDPAKACRLLEKWGPAGATLACLIILVQELAATCYGSTFTHNVRKTKRKGGTLRFSSAKQPTCTPYFNRTAHTLHATRIEHFVVPRELTLVDERCKAPLDMPLGLFVSAAIVSARLYTEVTFAVRGLRVAR